MTEWIVTSSVLILLVMGLRLLLKGKISLRLQYGLWALVLLRLLIPFSLDSRLSVMNVIPEPELLKQTVEYDNYQLPDSTAPEVSPTLSPEQPQTQPFAPQIETQKESIKAPITPDTVLLWLWVVGMTVTAGVLLGTNLHLHTKLKRSRSRWEAAASPIPVYITGCIQTPCLFGLFQPSIYLTPELSGAQTLQHVQTHELTHYRHLDHIWSALRCLCLALHWYNPLVWIAATLSKQDAELACDEAAIRLLGEAQRTAYGKTLIEMSCIKRNTAGLFLTATTMLTTKKSLKERISMIARKPKTAVITLICVLLIAIAAVGCTFTGASQGQSEDVPTMRACHFEGKNAIYVYEYPGFGSDFFIKLNRDGTFTYSEGSLSSYFGIGTWTLKDDILALTDKRTTSLAFYNEFRVEEDGLVWLAENSTGFLYRGNVPLADGGRFLYRGSEESPVPNIMYLEDITDVAKGIFDGGLRGTFVNVNGVVFVWNHFAVETLEGLAATEVGTVTKNDITAIPDTHLAACRVSEGTVLYLGKDVENSAYPAVYCKVNDASYYARFLPETAFHGDQRWWEGVQTNEGAQPLLLQDLIVIAKEKGGMLSHTDLQGYTHLELTSSNHLVYRIYKVEDDYRLTLSSANTQTPVEVMSAKLYHKDDPDTYIDIRFDDIATFVFRHTKPSNNTAIGYKKDGVTYATFVYKNE